MSLMLFTPRQYSQGNCHVFDTPFPLSAKMVSLPFAVPGVYLLAILLEGFFSSGHIDFTGATQWAPDDSSTDAETVGGFWSVIIVLLILVPSLGAALLAWLGYNRQMVDDNTQTVTSETIFIGSFRKHIQSLSNDRQIFASHNNRKGGWIVSLSGAVRPLAVTVREQTTRRFAFDAAIRLGASLNDIDSHRVTVCLARRLAEDGVFGKAPARRKNVVVQLEEYTDGVQLRHPPTMSLRLVAAGLAAFLSLVWYWLWPDWSLPWDKLVILLLLTLGLSVFIVLFVVKSFASSLFEMTIDLSPGRVRVYSNFRLFVRSGNYATDEIREILKQRDGIRIISDHDITRFARGVATTDKTYICNYIQYWLVQQVAADRPD